MNRTDCFKSLDAEKRIFTAVVLRPDVVDAHGDIYDSEVVEKAAHDFMKYSQQSNIQHMFDVSAEEVTIVESYIAPADMSMGDGEILKGDWVMSVKINNDDIWKMCKNGDFTGFSVGCQGVTVDVGEEDD